MLAQRRAPSHAHREPDALGERRRPGARGRRRDLRVAAPRGARRGALDGARRGARRLRSRRRRSPSTCVHRSRCSACRSGAGAARPAGEARFRASRTTGRCRRRRWRARDVRRDIDLVEEVARFRLEDVPATLPVRQAMFGRLTHEQRLRRQVEDVLVGAGLYEAYTYSLQPEIPIRARSSCRCRSRRSSACCVRRCDWACSTPPATTSPWATATSSCSRSRTSTSRRAPCPTSVGSSAASCKAGSRRRRASSSSLFESLQVEPRSRARSLLRCGRGCVGSVGLGRRVRAARARAARTRRPSRTERSRRRRLGERLRALEARLDLQRPKTASTRPSRGEVALHDRRRAATAPGPSREVDVRDLEQRDVRRCPRSTLCRAAPSSPTASVVRSTRCCELERHRQHDRASGRDRPAAASTCTPRRARRRRARPRPGGAAAARASAGRTSPAAPAASRARPRAGSARPPRRGRCRGERRGRATSASCTVQSCVDARSRAARAGRAARPRRSRARAPRSCTPGRRRSTAAAAARRAPRRRPSSARRRARRAAATRRSPPAPASSGSTPFSQRVWLSVRMRWRSPLRSTVSGSKFAASSKTTSSSSLDLGVLAAHDAGDRDRPLGVGDHEVVRVELALRAVERLELLARLAPGARRSARRRASRSRTRAAGCRARASRSW